MSSDIERAWRPRIYRAWNRHSGHFYWAVTRPQQNSWTGATLSNARRLENRAVNFARDLNIAEIGDRAIKLRDIAAVPTFIRRKSC